MHVGPRPCIHPIPDPPDPAESAPPPVPAAVLRDGLRRARTDTSRPVPRRVPRGLHNVPRPSPLRHSLHLGLLPRGPPRDTEEGGHRRRRPGGERVGPHPRPRPAGRGDPAAVHEDNPDAQAGVRHGEAVALPWQHGQVLRGRVGGSVRDDARGRGEVAVVDGGLRRRDPVPDRVGRHDGLGDAGHRPEGQPPRGRPGHVVVRAGVDRAVPGAALELLVRRLAQPPALPVDTAPLRRAALPEADHAPRVEPLPPRPRQAVEGAAPPRPTLRRPVLLLEGDAAQRLAPVLLDDELHPRLPRLDAERGGPGDVRGQGARLVVRDPDRARGGEEERLGDHQGGARDDQADGGGRGGRGADPTAPGRVPQGREAERLGPRGREGEAHAGVEPDEGEGAGRAGGLREGGA
ncbi:hypothetical protein THAOC_05970, partial [Thalassiosira oceanica]